MNRPILSILAFVAIAMGGPASARAGLSNGGFEQPNLYDPSNPSTFSNYYEINAGSTALTGWTVESGNVDVLRELPSMAYYLGGNLPALPAVEGMQYLDLNGDTAGTISQVMSATAGQGYQLSFSYAGYADSNVAGDSTDKSIIVQLFDGTTGSVLTQETVPITVADLYNWSVLTFQATATSDELGVRFASSGNGSDSYIGPLIDNVVLAPAGTSPLIPVPEPSSLFLTATAGLLALGHRLRGR